MKRHIILALDAPLMSFGDHSIDARVPTARFPAVSAISGMIANALGYNRAQIDALSRLQRRLRFAARIERAPAGIAPLSDFQTADLQADDRAWTTRGQPEGRRGSPATYKGSASAINTREYHADAIVVLAARLDPADEPPTLSDIAQALIKPVHAPYIGRKSCIPADRLYRGETIGETTLSALLAAPLITERPAEIAVMWREGEGAPGIEPERAYAFADERNWRAGHHGGGAMAFEASINPARIKGDSL